MLIIPMGTDAPIYHWPFATVGLMVLNLALLIAVPPPNSHADAEDEEGVESVEAPTHNAFEKYALTLGHGLHPVQWVTHNFLHDGWFHLIGNLIFLWAFGVVVEGKLGLVRYLAVYLAIGTLHGALTQTIFLFSGLHGHAVGASAIVFGLLAICMVWAPRNEVHCTWILWVGFRVFIHQFYLRYTWLAGFYVGQQLLNLAWAGVKGTAVVSEAGHLSGALWGFLIGMGMLKMAWVDCEGWDVLTIWKKDRQLAKEWKLRGDRHERQNRSERAPRKHVVAEAQAGDEPSLEERSASAMKKIRKHLDSGDRTAALTAYDRATRTLPNWPAAPELVALIKEMHGHGAENDSLPLMRDYCRRYPDTAHRMRLKVAQVLIRDRQKPAAALGVLTEIPEGVLPAQLDAARRGLILQATKMRDEGVLELEGED